MPDDPKKVGKGDRIRAWQQQHEVRFIAEKFDLSGQAALGAIRAAGPMRKTVYDYIKAKTRSGDYRTLDAKARLGVIRSGPIVGRISACGAWVKPKPQVKPLMDSAPRRLSQPPDSMASPLRRRTGRGA